MRSIARFVIVIALATLPLSARMRPRERTVEDYLKDLQLHAVTTVQAASGGSLFIPATGLADLTSDYRARTVGDPITIQVAESTSADAQGTTQTQRKFETSTGISGLAGKINTAGVNDILSGKSSTVLQGTGQHNTSSTISTVLTGQVVAILPSGQLVIEAHRSILVNNERQVLIVRGIVRNADISPANAVTSTQVANLELELKGKGVISDATRAPNIIVRTLLKLISF